MYQMAKTIELAVVGHTNAGKTSLLRTLTRRTDFGQVSDKPGTTREVIAIALMMDGIDVIHFQDTPGLEDAPSLVEHLNSLDSALAAYQKIDAFLKGPESEGDFEQEAKVLRCMKSVDAALLVVDTRESPLPKFSKEVELLKLCAKPILPVLNYVGDQDSKESEWVGLFKIHGLHTRATFQTVAPMRDAEKNLYHDLGGLLPERRAELTELIEYLALERLDRHASGLRLVGELVLGLAAYRQTLDATVMSDEPAKLKATKQFRLEVASRCRQGLESMLELHGFKPGSAATTELPQLMERWSDDLYSAHALKKAGKRLGVGATLGGAAGLAADAALAGLSMGAGVTGGAALGAFLSQGRVGAKLVNKLRGIGELSLDDNALMVLVAQQLSMLIALERRAHADQFQLRDPSPIKFSEDEDETILRAITQARTYPEWAESKNMSAKQRKARDTQNEILCRHFRDIEATKLES